MTAQLLVDFDGPLSLRGASSCLICAVGVHTSSWTKAFE
jgi:hypothetical protein